MQKMMLVVGPKPHVKTLAKPDLERAFLNPVLQGCILQGLRCRQTGSTDPAPGVQRALCWLEWNERLSNQDYVWLPKTVVRESLWGGRLQFAAGLCCRATLLGG